MVRLGFIGFYLQGGSKNLPKRLILAQKGLKSILAQKGQNPDFGPKTTFFTLKTLKIRDKSDIERKHGALKKTSDSVLINSDKLSRLRTFKMINNIMIRKLKA